MDRVATAQAVVEVVPAQAVDCVTMLEDVEALEVEEVVVVAILVVAMAADDALVVLGCWAEPAVERVSMEQ